MAALTFSSPHTYNERVGRARVALALALVLVATNYGAAADVRRVVEAFVNRLGTVELADLSIQQTITLYNPDGQHPASTGEQQLLLKLPGRERLEQAIEGQ